MKYVKQEFPILSFPPSTDHRQLPSSLQRLSPPTPPLLRRLLDRGDGVGTRTRDLHHFISRRCQEDGAEGLLRRPDAASARCQKVGSGGRGDKIWIFLSKYRGKYLFVAFFLEQVDGEGRAKVNVEVCNMTLTFCRGFFCR